MISPVITEITKMITNSFKADPGIIASIRNASSPEVAIMVVTNAANPYILCV